MTQRALFYAGCVLAVAGLGFSLTMRPRLEVAGSVVMLAAILCALAMVYLGHVHRTPALFPRWRPWLPWISIVLIVAALANFMSFGRPTLHPYAQTLMMFLLAIQTLLNGASYSSFTAASRHG